MDFGVVQRAMRCCAWNCTVTSFQVSFQRPTDLTWSNCGKMGLLKISVCMYVRVCVCRFVTAAALSTAATAVQSTLVSSVLPCRSVQVLVSYVKLSVCLSVHLSRRDHHCHHSNL